MPPLAIITELKTDKNRSAAKYHQMEEIVFVFVRNDSVFEVIGGGET